MRAHVLLCVHVRMNEVVFACVRVWAYTHMRTHMLCDILDRVCVHTHAFVGALTPWE